jgi:hypothetical protein
MRLAIIVDYAIMGVVFFDAAQGSATAVGPIPPDAALGDLRDLLNRVTTPRGR